MFSQATVDSFDPKAVSLQLLTKNPGEITVSLSELNADKLVKLFTHIKAHGTAILATRSMAELSLKAALSLPDIASARKILAAGLTNEFRDSYIRTYRARNYSYLYVLFTPANKVEKDVEDIVQSMERIAREYKNCNDNYQKHAILLSIIQPILNLKLQQEGKDVNKEELLQTLNDLLEQTLDHLHVTSEDLFSTARHNLVLAP